MRIKKYDFKNIKFSQLFNIIFEGIGTVFTASEHFQIKFLKDNGSIYATIKYQIMEEIKVQHPETFEYYFHYLLGILIPIINIILLIVVIYYIIKLYRKIIKYLDKKNDVQIN